MNILLLWSGIADPNKPLPRELDAAALARHAAHDSVPSPFDEAALEIALKLRDRDPAIRIAAWCAGSEALARRLAAYPVQTPALLQTLPPPWDAAARVQALTALRPGLPFAPDLVLLGREFGDWDDGSLPVLLARAWELPHLSLATAIEAQGDRLVVTRQSGAALELVHAGAPLLVTATNAAANKLRHPLMKNVMLAKRAQLPVLGAAVGAAGTALAALHHAEPAPRALACELLGGSAEEQARALADRLAGLLAGGGAR